jgi:hypothetical protein
MYQIVPLNDIQGFELANEVGVTSAGSHRGDRLAPVAPGRCSRCRGWVAESLPGSAGCSHGLIIGPDELA